MRAFHRCFLPSFSSFGRGALEAYLSVIQFIANCILLISIFNLELSPFPQKNSFFIKYKIINMNCLWRPCLLMDRDEMSSLYRGPSIDASYQVSVHLAEGFQGRFRRLKCEKLTDDERQLMAKTLPLARWAKKIWFRSETLNQSLFLTNFNSF